MKWQKTQYSEKLSLGSGLITAAVQWVISGKGYEGIVNRNVIGIFPHMEDAKKAIEDDIRSRIRKVLMQIES